MIRQGIALESDIKTVERYNIETRIQQCCKCQDYGHNTYGVMTTGWLRLLPRGYQSQGLFGLVGMSISSRCNG